MHDYAMQELTATTIVICPFIGKAGGGKDVALMNQWVTLQMAMTRNELLHHNPESGIPEAPTNQNVPHGMEHRKITLFLDLNG